MCSAAPSRRRRCCSIRPTEPSRSGSRSRGVDAQPPAGDRRRSAAQHRRLRGRRRLPHRRARPRFRARWRSARPATRSWRSRPAASPAEEARALGVHVNFAPVVDVNNNPRNPVINTRSFGEDPELVGRLASALRPRPAGRRRDGDAEAFPGHGDTDVDSHLGLPVIKHPRERLDKIELPPFKAASPRAPTR